MPFKFERSVFIQHYTLARIAIWKREYVQEYLTLEIWKCVKE